MMKKKLLLTFFWGISVISSLQAQVVSTLAGSGIQGATNGTGTAASFYSPEGIAVDGAGNVYVADNNHLIRKIIPTGLVSTFAGSVGVYGHADGTGVAASFYSPREIAIDGSGNLYVADANNNLIRKITPAGVVSTLAGSGVHSSVNGIGTAASFNSPTGIAVDGSGNVYVSEIHNHLIRKITSDGVVSTFAGSGDSGYADGLGTAASFANPHGIAIDGSGNLYVADTYNSRIRKITPAGMVSTFAGSGVYGSANGLGTAASFGNPHGVAIDGSGNLYVTDTNNSLIRKITPTGLVSTLAGSGFQGATNGTGTAASFNFPIAIAVDVSGNAYVADSRNNRIRKITGMTTGIESLISVSDMKFYPIPARQSITLGITLQCETNLKLELINTAGIKVAGVEAEYNSGYNELRLSVAELPAGLYIANIYFNEQLTSQRIIIDK